MLLRWPSSSNSTTGTDSPVSFPRPGSGVSSAILARMFVRSATGRKRYNILGALNAVTHEVVQVYEEGDVSAQTVFNLLRPLIDAGWHVSITAILDNACYQRCGLVQKVAQKLVIRLLFLPPYSLNLDLIERLWRFVRK